MQKLDDRDVVFENGIFSREFPIESEYLAINKACIAEYKDLVEVSNMFKCQFYNADIMKNGGIYTVKVKSDCNLIYPLKKNKGKK